jgi:predicted Zn finger-like uncharacterized protein
MATLVTCPQCQKKLKVAETSIGKSVKCPCGNVFKAEVDEPVEASPAAPSGGTMVVTCDECQTRLKVPASAQGRKMKCSKCGATFVVGAAEESTVTPAKTRPAPPPRPAPPAFDHGAAASSAPQEAAEESEGAAEKLPWMTDDAEEQPPPRVKSKPKAVAAAAAEEASPIPDKKPAKASGCVGCLLSVVVFFIVIGYLAALGIVLTPTYFSDNEIVKEYVLPNLAPPFARPTAPKLHEPIRVDTPEDHKKADDKKADDKKADDKKADDKKADDKKADDKKADSVSARGLSHLVVRRRISEPARLQAVHRL